jgi:hypothetical protein
MTPDLRIQQAIALADARGVKIIAATPELDTAEVERIAVLFGSRPTGIACPLAHFASPFGKTHVAVVRVEDRPGEFLGFRFLVLHRELYRHLGDPFAISDLFPANWHATGTLVELEWPPERLPERTLEQLDAVLREGDGPLLLGAVQAIVDGNRVLIKRDAPDEALVRGLWQLLPDRSRVDRWPATFAFSDELGFHAAVLPVLSAAPREPKPLTEEAVKDYPASSYELNLQIAIESRDREGLRRLLARRTADDTIRLGLYMIAFAVIMVIMFRFIL